MAQNTTQYRVLIADDEAPARRELKRLLQADHSLVLVAEAENGLDAYTKALQLRPDVVFLDIQMPAMTGIETAQGFVSNGYFPLIVFVTAYDEYAVKAFEVHAIDYILKPVRKERFDMVLQRIHAQLNEEIEQSAEQRLLLLLSSLKGQPQADLASRISVYQGERIIPIRTDEIIYAEAFGRTCRVKTKEGLFTTGYPMYELQKILSPSLFFLCHRSYLVNLDCIESIELWVNSTYRLKMMHCDTLIPVSRGSTGELKQLLHLQ
ncbi:MAG: response regulator transcription factor [Spirochaetia bacterium]|nr:LytTR family DNA-binding domain-containing protein [Sphaerochaeta sp.]NCC63155.1 response regulator transcription factor [Spirochaetia bacterium]